MKEIGQKAKKAAKILSRANTAQKNEALHALASLIDAEQELIESENQKDIDEGEKNGLSEAMIDRLSLQGRLSGLCSDIERVAELGDPIGEKYDQKKLENGLKITKQRVPIGVLGVIYESRPNVTVDVASLAIKTGNCAILRGGSETIRTNKVLVKLIGEALSRSGLPPEAVQFIDNPDRSLVKELLHLHEYVDLIIPRGGAKLHQFCRENSSIPVITGGIGVCHLYVDKGADLERSVEVVFNAKTQRPTVCNSLDTLLIHKAVAAEFVPMAIRRLKEAGVSFRFDEKSWNLAGEKERKAGQKAGGDDWSTEWLDLILGVKVVEDLGEAVEHITAHSTGHSDGILTPDKDSADRFVSDVDSAAVYVNASTRFTDGSQFGMGAEVAISTQKLHARGPMGLKELTSYKWVVEGNYHVRK